MVAEQFVSAFLEFTFLNDKAIPKHFVLYQDFLEMMLIPESSSFIDDIVWQEWWVSQVLQLVFLAQTLFRHFYRFRAYLLLLLQGLYEQVVVKRLGYVRNEAHVA